LELHEVVEREVLKELELGALPRDKWASEAKGAFGLSGAQVYVALRGVSRLVAGVRGSTYPDIAEELISMNGLEHPVLRDLISSLLGDEDPRVGPWKATSAEKWSAAREGRDLRIQAWFTWKESFATRDSNRESAEELCRMAYEHSVAVQDRNASAHCEFLLGWFEKSVSPPRWQAAIGFFRKAESGFRDTGDKTRQAHSAHEIGLCSIPSRTRHASWRAAARSFALAANLFRSEGDRVLEAESLAWQADCTSPQQNPNGSWSEAAPLYQRAAMLYGLAGELRKQGSAIMRQAYCYAADPNVVSRWTLAATVFEEACVPLREAGELAVLAEALYHQGRCLLRAHKPVEARKVLMEARVSAARDGSDELIHKIDSVLR